MIFDQRTPEFFSRLKLKLYEYDFYISSETRTPVLVGFEKLRDVLKYVIFEKKFSAHPPILIINQRNYNIFPSHALPKKFLTQFENPLETNQTKKLVRDKL